jgi:hypothetical protein
MSADEPDDPIRDAYFRKYSKIYNPVANAKALEEMNAEAARRGRMAGLFGTPKKARPR